MSITTRIPADNPHDWLGPEWTVYHWQEDNLSDWDFFISPDFIVDITGNGYCTRSNILMQGSFTVGYMHKIFNSFPSSIACSINMNKVTETEALAGLVSQDSIDGTDVMFYGNIAARDVSASLKNLPITFTSKKEKTSLLGVLMHSVDGTRCATVDESIHFDGCNTSLYLKIERVSSELSNLYFSTDGVGWSHWDDVLTDDHDLLGFGFWMGSGVVGSGIDEIGVSFDWVAHT
jgi:hypothetical protein